MIAKRDFPILRAFLEREADMFNFGKSGESGRQEFVDRMFQLIIEHKDNELPIHGEGYNYIKVQSITNMGLLDSELALSGDPWSSERSIFCSLPPSPLGDIGFSTYLSGSI